MEQWIEILGYEGLYRVGNHGHIESCWTGKWERLKPKLDTHGYHHVDLYLDGKRTAQRIHRLVAQAFLPNPEEKPEINHKDGNKINNAVTNLEWATSSENNMHAFRVLGRQTPRGEQHGSAKLTADDVKQIRRLYATGNYTQQELGNTFGVRQGEVSHIVRRKNWVHI